MQEPMTRLLIVDDEPAMRRALRISLQPMGYTVEEASSGEAALRLLASHQSTIVLLDINMPGVGGIETCRTIRRIAPGSAVVMITVRDGEDDKVKAFEAGADDYITKPFRLRELVARLQAVRRRTQGSTETPVVLRAGVLQLDVTNRTLLKGGAEIHLSQKEFDILSYLMRHANTPVPHARLLKAVWGPEYGGETEYLRTYVKHLRRKIEQDAARPEYILTEPWLGYRFHKPDNIAPRADAEYFV
jgi:two-component system KDP operon response regulator KdpE